MILDKNGVIASENEPIKTRRKYWLNTAKNEMYQLVNNEYVKLIKTVDIVVGEEVATGLLVDGKVEYQKRISVGNLPNNTSLVVETGLNNVHWSRKLERFCFIKPKPSKYYATSLHRP